MALAEQLGLVREVRRDLRRLALASAPTLSASEVAELLGEGHQAAARAWLDQHAAELEVHGPGRERCYSGARLRVLLERPAPAVRPRQRGKVVSLPRATRRRPPTTTRPPAKGRDGVTMNRADILKLTADAVTPAIFAEAGIDRVPVKPDWSIAETVLGAFVEAGQPDVRFFDGVKVVPVAEWDRRRKTPAWRNELDPIRRTPLDAATAAEWDSLAPIKTATGPVPARKLCAYAAARGLLDQDITSTVARLVLPRDADPVDAPPGLAAAALEWPYEEDGEGIVTAWLSAPARVAHRQPAPVARASPPSGGTPIARLADLLQSLFSVGEMRRFVRWGPYGDYLAAHLPGEPATRADVAWAAAEQYRSHGLLDPELFDRLLRERPGRDKDIAPVRALFC